MSKLLITLSIISISFISKAQNQLNNDFYDLEDLDIRPSLVINDSVVDVNRFVFQNIRWKDGMNEGERVFLSCIVDTNGQVGCIELIKIPEMCDLCTIETVRVVSSLPNFTPGYKNGKKVNAKILIWVRFEIERN
jgi:hypothetical protein